MMTTIAERISSNVKPLTRRRVGKALIGARGKTGYQGAALWGMGHGSKVLLALAPEACLRVYPPWMARTGTSVTIEMRRIAGRVFINTENIRN
jgi:hypothetical protein